MRICEICLQDGKTIGRSWLGPVMQCDNGHEWIDPDRGADDTTRVRLAAAFTRVMGFIAHGARTCICGRIYTWADYRTLPKIDDVETRECSCGHELMWLVDVDGRPRDSRAEGRDA